VPSGKETWALKDVPGLEQFGEYVIRYVSPLYSLITAESMQSGISAPLDGLLWESPFDEFASALAFPLDGTLISTLLTYSDWPVESLDSGKAIPQIGTLAEVLLTYTDWPVENLDAGKAIPQTGTLPEVLLTYTNWPTENLDSGKAIPQNGTLA
ncbi:MAG: hypothetical protein ACRCVX_17035, partial [Shewanella sp.]